MDVLKSNDESLKFLSGGGEMGKLIRNYDWSDTSIGSPLNWPQSLRTAVNILLSSKFPMMLWWGPELIQFYNEAYRPCLGDDGKHHGAIGQQGKDCWKEIWLTIQPIIQDVLHTGKSHLSEHQKIPVYLNGKMEEVWWTFSYSAVIDEHDEIAGVLVVCHETTKQVETIKKVTNTKNELYNLMMQAPVAMCLYREPDYKVEMVNKRMLDIWGKTRESVIGKPVFEALPEARGQGFETLLENVYKTGESFTANEIPISLHRNGKTDSIFVNLLYEAYRDADGEISGIVEVANDVTEHVLIRNKIEENEKRFEAAIAAVEGVVWTNNAQGEMLGEQPGWTKLTGQQFEDYKGYGWVNVVHPDDAKPTVEAWNKAVLARDTFIFEHRLKVKNGEWIRFSVRAVPVFNPDKSIREWVGVHTDINDEWEAEQKIMESEQRFRNLADESPMFIFIIDADSLGTVSYWNKTWLNYTGQTAKEAAGRAWEGIIHPDDVPVVMEYYSTAFTNKAPYFIPAARTKRHDGKYRWHAYKGNPRYSANGDFNGYVGVGFDVHEQKLAEADIKRFKYMADNASDPFILMREDGTFAYLNKMALENWGYTKEEVKHIRVPDVDPIYNDKLFAKAFAQAQKEHLPQFETVHKRKDGSTFPVEINMGGLLIDGEPHMFAVARNISERKKYEENLAYRTALLEAHQQASVDGVLLVDAKGKIISFNHRFIEIWNMPQHIVDAKDDEMALSFAMAQLINPQQFIDKVKYLYENPSEKSIDELEFKNGKIIQRHGYPVVGDDNAYYAWSWTFRDITEQRLFEKTLQESEERFRLLADEMPQFVWVGDIDGTLNYFNKAVYEYTGITEEEVLNGGWIQIVHPHDREKNISLWQEAIGSGNLFHYEHRFKNSTGDYRWQLSRAVPQRDANGNIQRWLGTSTDIHDQKLFTEKLEKLVQERTRELSVLNKQLSNSNEDLQQFAHVASHDLKEPLRKIKTYALRMKEDNIGKLSEKSEAHFTKILRATDRMFSMIDGVLTYSTANAAEEALQSVDLNQLMDAMVLDLELLISEKQATIKFSNLPVIEGASILLYQMLYNLVTNSLKFVKPGVPPVIKITSTNIEINKIKYARIEVSDNGIGFNKADEEIIFNTFSRLNSKDRFEGTGLGLSLCKKIAERHGGFISAKAIKDTGAIFIINLPFIQQKPYI